MSMTGFEIANAEPMISSAFAVELDLANQDDIYRARTGMITPEQIRRSCVIGIVGTRATRLVIPAAIAQQLGLEISGSAKVRCANGQSAERPIAQNIHLSYGGRESVFNGIVEPDRQSILVGAIVLEDLDFFVDCVTQRLVPRDPNQIVSEAE